MLRSASSGLKIHVVLAAHAVVQLYSNALVLLLLLLVRRAFSTTGAVEGIQFITNKILKSLSEQQLVDCSTNGNEGCNGGWPYDAYQWIIQVRVCVCVRCLV